MVLAITKGQSPHFLAPLHGNCPTTSNLFWRCFNMSAYNNLRLSKLMHYSLISCNAFIKFFEYLSFYLLFVTFCHLLLSCIFVLL